MKYNFCTLFDSGYLDRGIPLYKSLAECMSDFTLYVYAFDKKAYDILLDLKYEKMVVLFINDIEDEQMRLVRSERSKAEYCWTCTPIIIEDALNRFSLDNCTYIDADMYFFADPSCLIQEMKESDCDVLITKHGFPNNREGKINERKSGKYCVQFNTFLDERESRKILTKWKEQCLECCTSAPKDDKFGDQKYLEEWTSRYQRVHESTNLGAGVANWNITRFKFEKMEAGVPIIMECATGKCMPLIFYHFHGLKELPDGRMDINVYRNRGKVDNRLIEFVYGNYFNAFREARKILTEKYDIRYDKKGNVYSVKTIKTKAKKPLEERYYEMVRMIKARIYRKKDIYYI